MKTFAHYLTESTQTYDYRIKFVGEVNNDFLKDFKQQLKKFDPESISDVKKTPIQSELIDFPAFSNEPISMIDVVLKYPATMPQVQQMAELLGFDPNKINLCDTHYADTIDAELLGIADQNKDLLNSAYPEPTKEQKDLSKDYGEGNQQVVKNSAEEALWTVAGGKTQAATFTSSLPMGDKSPLTDIKRPPKPATGNHPKG